MSSPVEPTTQGPVPAGPRAPGSVAVTAAEGFAPAVRSGALSTAAVAPGGGADPHLAPGDDIVRTASGEPAFVVTRTTRGWAVLTPAGAEDTPVLVEAMSLADLIAEDLGASPEPRRDARRAARGSGDDAADAADPRDARIALLERTVGQLEHALATRVSTERAIGVLAARSGISPREAFEGLRKRARSTGRAVHDLAREVLDSLTAAPTVPAPPGPPPGDPGHRGTARRVERSRARRPAAPRPAEGEH